MVDQWFMMVGTDKLVVSCWLSGCWGPLPHPIFVQGSHHPQALETTKQLRLPSDKPGKSIMYSWFSMVSPQKMRVFPGKLPVKMGWTSFIAKSPSRVPRWSTSHLPIYRAGSDALSPRPRWATWIGLGSNGQARRCSWTVRTTGG